MRARLLLTISFLLCVSVADAQQRSLPRTPSPDTASLAATSVSKSSQIAAKDENDLKPDTLKRQLRIAFDFSKPVLNAILNTRTSYEVAADYYLGRDLYAVLETGFGSGRFDFDDLRYRSSNAFVRVGVEKSLLVRLSPTDWDGAFAGLRYGYAPVRRGEATFTTRDTVWGGTSGTVPALSRGVSWVELTGGVRVEVVNQVQLGWTVRGKFLFSQSAFTDLRPSFIAGYGQGDKNTVFDFNVWVAYALRR